MRFMHDKEQRALVMGCGLALACIVFIVFARFGANTPSTATVYENILAQRRLLAQMGANLRQSAEMERNAVMVLSAESEGYAEQSRTAAATLERELAALRSLVEATPMPNEKKLLEAFAACWTELGALDRDILQLAVANTNIKAAFLSREQGEASLERFERALAAIRASAAGGPEEYRVAEQTSQALIAALKIFTLHAPHIVEADDDKMDRLEARMQAEEKVARHALATLEANPGNENRGALARAQAAFAEFTGLTAKTIQLSRQNSNIKSLGLSMGKKRIVLARCEDGLAALTEAVDDQTFKATK
ncbi:MCP four helix bundle domain-containing protein [Desulfobulbus sp.]|uniref:MCP four helix bundle domain-containing protein n=1 Tax=Desulfobulbus sp. TaxID=895 RepID=UPI00286F6CB9|nr:MCP four helix bundle domain-containing protein [Desulfobulbus sp.]